MTQVIECVKLETIILFDSDGNPRIKSNYEVDEDALNMILDIIRPFTKNPGVKDRLLSGQPMKISALMRGDCLESYCVKFTTSTTVTSTSTTVNKSH